MKISQDSKDVHSMDQIVCFWLKIRLLCIRQFFEWVYYILHIWVCPQSSFSNKTYFRNRM